MFRRHFKVCGCNRVRSTLCRESSDVIFLESHCFIWFYFKFQIFFYIFSGCRSFIASVTEGKREALFMFWGKEKSCRTHVVSKIEKVIDVSPPAELNQLLVNKQLREEMPESTDTEKGLMQKEAELRRPKAQLQISQCREFSKSTRSAIKNSTSYKIAPRTGSVVN